MPIKLFLYALIFSTVSCEENLSNKTEKTTDTGTENEIPIIPNYCERNRIIIDCVENPALTSCKVDYDGDNIFSSNDVELARLGSINSGFRVSGKTYVSGEEAFKSSLSPLFEKLNGRGSQEEIDQARGDLKNCDQLRYVVEINSSVTMKPFDLEENAKPQYYMSPDNNNWTAKEFQQFLDDYLTDSDSSYIWSESPFESEFVLDASHGALRDACRMAVEPGEVGVIVFKKSDMTKELSNEFYIYCYGLTVE